MTLPEILALSRVQGRRPWTWAIVLALGLTNFLSDTLVPHAGPPRPLWYYGLYFLAVLTSNGCGIWVGPWPWQWTGRPGDYPPLLRGLGQALLFGTACFIPVLLLRMGVHALVRPGSLSYGLYLLRSFAVTFITMSCLMGFGVVAFQKEDAAREEAEQKAQAARWMLLRGQMNPRFFLEAMDRLVDLIRLDPAAAERASMRLSGLFRRIMDHGRSHLVSLASERALVERYLELEGLWLGTAPRVAWEWDPELDEVLVPPFLMQPLVENAIKHALALPPAGGELRISGQLQGGRVALQVENPVAAPVPPQAPSRGLDDLEARLRLAFGEEGAFRLVHTPALTRAELTFPVLQEAL
ncbi:sensor histidine kinase [Mesoterricola silvestris]|uniref:Histidine kinase n=1 Tax=Mesoterricola silvestris TaxID=2927979 RepID=A0AA48K836_9BACT|nr:histidine kinase [Mesoterricola silvestris]BDU72544.1 histidine kinase [Mesoterricola silvestris]